MTLARLDLQWCRDEAPLGLPFQLPFVELGVVLPRFLIFLLTLWHTVWLFLHHLVFPGVIGALEAVPSAPLSSCLFFH